MEFPDLCKTIGSAGHIPFAGCIYSRESQLPIASGETQEVASLLGHAGMVPSISSSCSINSP